MVGVGIPSAEQFRATVAPSATTASSGELRNVGGTGDGILRLEWHLELSRAKLRGGWMGRPSPSLVLKGEIVFFPISNGRNVAKPILTI